MHDPWKATWKAKPNLPQDARDALEFLREYVERRYPASVHDIPVFTMTPQAAVDGFAVSRDGGMSIFWASGPEVPGGAWLLRVATVVGFEIPDIQSALLWANARNRDQVNFRYWCAINHELERCAVIARADFQSVVLADFWPTVDRLGLSPVIELLKGMATTVITVAVSDSTDLLSRVSGRRLTPTPPDLDALFILSDG